MLKVTTLYNAKMKRAGHVLNTNICTHLAMAYVDLFNVIKVRKLRTFGEVMETIGIDKNAIGCEICKPAVGSIESWQRRLIPVLVDYGWTTNRHFRRDEGRFAGHLGGAE